MNDNLEEYDSPSLTVYGSAEEVTGDQSSDGNDFPAGADNNTVTYYSVGK